MTDTEILLLASERDSSLAFADAGGLIAFARAIEAKVNQDRLTIRHYQNCKAHEGRNWNMVVSSAYSPYHVKTVRPICTGEAT